jgi:HlyD family secretion protein
MYRVMKRDRLRGAAVLAVMGTAAAVGVAACDTSADDEPAMGLSTATATVMSITSTVAATGTIEPVRVIDVKSQASGEVLEVPVELGDDAARGDLLVRIDPRDVRNAYEQAAADLEVAEARNTVAERQLGRTQNLRESKVVTEEEYESALLESANARASLVKAETNLELAKDKLDDVTVRSPITGTIVEKTVEEGQIITSAKEVTGGTILLRMADLNEVQVRTLVDETDIGSIQSGLTASIRVEAYPDREFRGQVLQVEPQAVVEQSVTLFAVLTRIRNEEGLLKPGMNADVEIVVGIREGVLALPNSAIKTQDEARQLVNALGMDEELLRQRVESQHGPGGKGGERAHGDSVESDAGGAEPAGAGAGGLPSMEEIQSMSRDERRRLMEGLSAADRQRMIQMFRQMQEQRQRQDHANSGSPKPAFVFVAAPDGVMSLKPVMIGLSSWEYTEIVGGLEEGDEVLQVPLSLVQQQELLERIRSRTALPGISR